MVADRHDAESSHEFRLEGIGLVLGGGFLIAVIAGAFFLGRWVERSADPAEVSSSDGAGPLAQITTREPDADAGQGLTYFDVLEGQGKQLEPARETTTRPAVTREAQPGPVKPSMQLEQPGARDGDFYVQVGAHRDQAAAAELIDTLKKQGYDVRLFSEREGQGVLYKVRVGGYATEQRARDTAGRLRSAGYAGAWVTAAD